MLWPLWMEKWIQIWLFQSPSYQSLMSPKCTYSSVSGPGQGILMALKRKWEERTNEGGGLSRKCSQVSIHLEQETIASSGLWLHRGSFDELMNAWKCLLRAGTPLLQSLQLLWGVGGGRSFIPPIYIESIPWASRCPYTWGHQGLERLSNWPNWGRMTGA